MAHLLRLLFGRRRELVFTVESDREADGRWIAEVGALPGVLAYGDSQSDAFRRAAALSLHVLADKLEHGETIDDLDLSPDEIPPVVFEHQHA